MWKIKQKVNLYSNEFRPPQPPKELIMTALLIATVVLLSLLIKIALFAFQQYLDNQIAAEELRKIQLVDQLQIENEKLAKLNVDPFLVAQVERERGQIQQRQKVLSFLREQRFSDGVSLAELTENLAVEDGVWLTNFRFFENGEQIELAGLSKKAQGVTDYLAILGSKEPYRGRTFKHIEIEELNDQKINKFRLSTKEEKIKDGRQRGRASVIGDFL